MRPCLPINHSTWSLSIGRLTKSTPQKSKEVPLMVKISLLFNSDVLFKIHSINVHWQFLVASLHLSQDPRNLLSLRAILTGVKTIPEEGFPHLRPNINVRLLTLYVLHKTCPLTAPHVASSRAHPPGDFHRCLPRREAPTRE